MQPPRTRTTGWRSLSGRTEAGKNATAENGQRDGTVGAAMRKRNKIENATAENRTRVSRVAGENSTTRPRLLMSMLKVLNCG